MRRVYTVGQVNRYIKGLFTEDAILAAIFVRGEVSNCKYHSSGHIYFSIKDQTGSLSCVMFAGNRRGLKFRMKDGDKVVISGSVDVYERDGRYQLYAREIELEGEGLLFERFLKLKKQLEAEGLFDRARKKPVPAYAQTVGVVTAPTGAAIRDIQNISRRRNPYVQIILYPALVQGDGAKESIARGIRMLDGMVDVIIVGRGGGSIEDLWAFNEELVARAIAECETPVISAVGHETDTTIADLAADLRAPTPSAAAELAVFDLRKFAADCNDYERRLFRSLTGKLDLMNRRADYAREALRARAPSAMIRDARHRAADLDNLLPELVTGRIREARDRAGSLSEKLPVYVTEQIREAQARSDRAEADMAGLLTSAFEDRKHRMAVLLAVFDGLSPIRRLSRGYSYVESPDRKAVTSVDAVEEGDILRIHVTDGVIRAEVTEKERLERAAAGEQI